MSLQLIENGNLGRLGRDVTLLRDLLGDVRAWFARYLFVMDERDLDVLALWTVHTWLCEETYTSPRLLIDSPVPGSGKTTLLEHLAKLSKHPAQMAAVSSSAMLARLTANGPRTLLIDEADRALDPKKPGVGDLLAILNSGYKMGATRPVLQPTKNGWEIEEMPTFSPVAIAGNTPLLPDDTRSRCIVVRLLPDLNEKVEPSDWELLDEPSKELAERIELVANEVREQIKGCRPEVPRGCVNRLKERWYPLKRIAEIADENWSQIVDELIVEDIDREKDRAQNGDVQLSPNLQLAKDLYELYSPEFGFIQTTSLVAQLIRYNPEQWSSDNYYGKDLTAQRLGQMLNRAFGVSSKSSTRDADGVRGYHANQLKGFWKQLGVSPVDPPSPPSLPSPPTPQLPSPNESDLF
jgi:energy-coupling factor transporter ATP-binding protein EcfA2